MSVSQACNYALTALQQEFSACGKASNSNAVTDCNCTSLDPESVTAYCNFPENDRNTWTTPYLAAVDARMNACLAVNKPVVSAPVIALPSYIPNPWAVQTGPLTPACTYIREAFEQRFRNCGKGPDAKAIDTCLCTGLCTYLLFSFLFNILPNTINSKSPSHSRPTVMPGNDQANWLNLYQDGAAARSNSCTKVGLPLTAIPVLSLPNNIPNPIKDPPTPAPQALTPACNYVLDAFNQRFRNCGKGADANSANTCICNGLFTESLLAYCDLPGNDKSKWITDYQSGVTARSDSCAKVGLPLNPIPLLSLPDSIPNPIPVTPPAPVASLTPACTYILDAFGQRFRNCGKGADAVSANTCICNGLFTESLLAYCDLPGNDKSKWFTDYQSGVSARSNSCAKVGLALTPIPLLSLPDNIPNPLKDTSASTSTSVAPSPIPPTKTTSGATDAKTSALSKPSNVVISGTGSIGLAGALMVACAVLI